MYRWSDFASHMSVDMLSIIMIALVGYVSTTILHFATRYLKGDLHANHFYCRVGLLIPSVITMVCTDNLWLLLLFWTVSNSLLIRLMIHEDQWPAAIASGWLAAKTFFIGIVCLSISFWLIQDATGQSTIHLIDQLGVTHHPKMQIASTLLMVTAMTQSAAWPFHRWLLSSLNSPTPVSAIMHAGLINGGGFLLVRFAPFISHMHHVMLLLYIFGIYSALLGTYWKFLQCDVKRMLACSTMGQMGFMLAQCGLGLFPAAVAHLCWHGLFKAYLFLNSASAAQEKRVIKRETPSIAQLIVSLLGGCLGAFGFALMSHKMWFPSDTTLVLNFIAFLAGAQLSMEQVRVLSFRWIPVIGLLTFIAGSIYGISVHLIENYMAPMGLMHPQLLNFIHLISMLVMFTLWLMSMYTRSWEGEEVTNFKYQQYVLGLNASQPHPSTVTSNRMKYQW